MDQKRAIVIGSGVAGLTAAAYLAQAGVKVKILEQFSEIGGVTATLHQDGFSWDLGPMFIEGIAPDEPAGDILNDLGIQDQITLIRDERGIEFPDFSLWKPEKYMGKYWRQQRLKEEFPKDSLGIDRYYSFYDKVVKLQALGHRLAKQSYIPGLITRISMLSIYNSIKNKFDWTAEELMDDLFHDEKLKAVFTALLADFVTPPSKFPAPGIPAINIESPFDKFMPLEGQPSYHYIKGGMENLVKALCMIIKKHNGEILTGKCVKRILVSEGKVTAVQLKDGACLKTDLVLASGGVRETMFHLIGKEFFPKEYIRLVEDVPLMESVHMIHLGIKFNPAQFQEKALCYYYNTYDIEGAIRDCREGHYEGGEHGFLIYIPSMHSPEMAPSGMHAITIYTIAPNILQKGNWQQRGEELSKMLLDRAEKKIPGLQKGSLTRIVLTPQDFRQRVHLEHDAFGGRAPYMGKKGGPHKTPVQGLWFIGRQSEKISGGICGTMCASKKVAQMIIREGGYNNEHE